MSPRRTCVRGGRAPSRRVGTDTRGGGGGGGRATSHDKGGAPTALHTAAAPTLGSKPRISLRAVGRACSASRRARVSLTPATSPRLPSWPRPACRARPTRSLRPVALASRPGSSPHASASSRPISPRLVSRSLHPAAKVHRRPEQHRYCGARRRRRLVKHKAQRRARRRASWRGRASWGSGGDRLAGGRVAVRWVTTHAWRRRSRITKETSQPMTFALKSCFLRVLK